MPENGDNFEIYCIMELERILFEKFFFWYFQLGFISFHSIFTDSKIMLHFGLHEKLVKHSKNFFSRIKKYFLRLEDTCIIFLTILVPRFLPLGSFFMH